MPAEIIEKIALIAADNAVNFCRVRLINRSFKDSLEKYANILNNSLQKWFCLECLHLGAIGYSEKIEFWVTIRAEAVFEGRRPDVYDKLGKSYGAIYRFDGKYTYLVRTDDRVY